MDKKLYKVIYSHLVVLFWVTILSVFVFMHLAYPHYFIYQEKTERDLVINESYIIYLDVDNKKPVLDKPYLDCSAYYVPYQKQIFVTRFYFQKCEAKNVPYGKENIYIRKFALFDFIYRHYGKIVGILIISIIFTEIYRYKYKKSESYLYNIIQLIKGRGDKK